MLAKWLCFLRLAASGRCRGGHGIGIATRRRREAPMLMLGTAVFAVVAFVYVQRRRARKKTA